MHRLNSFRVGRLAAAAVIIAAVVSCSDNGSPAAPAATGPSLTAPTAKSPIGAALTQTLRPVLEVTNSTATGNVGAVTYHFDVSDLSDFPSGAHTISIDNIAQGAATTSAPVPVDLVPARVYYWRARATSGTTVASPYSVPESFKADARGFKSGQTIYDPLTNGQTVADEVHGGHFVTGENGGWQADNLGDSLDYNIPTCTACKVEFDATNFDRSTDPVEIDQKWFSMGDGSTFNDFFAFREHPWKMHLEKRSGDGGAVKMIWRKGCNDDDSCDNTDNTHVSIGWEPAKLYHFTIEWGSGGMSVNVCEYNGSACVGTLYSAGGTGTYAPPNHRIELGTRPRSETLVGARFRNLKVTPR